MEIPASIRDVDHLEELLSEPSPAAIAAIRSVEGDIVILGVAGKMGPTLARWRAAPSTRRPAGQVIGVSRFPRRHREALDSTASDDPHLDEEALARLPDAANDSWPAESLHSRRVVDAGDDTTPRTVSPPHRGVLDQEHLASSTYAALPRGRRPCARRRR